jgi:hypothetical protein
MKIGLVDVDSKIANIPLMKISAYHKAIGDQVEWHNSFVDYDKVYGSKVFTFSKDYDYYPQNCEVIKGGTGYDIELELPTEIDKITTLDYSIYPNYKKSLQFFSRGCSEDCAHCLVRQKEGYIYATKPMELNPCGTGIEILDNNFFQSPEWESAVEQLVEWNQQVKFHGVDVRTITEEQCHSLKRLKMKQGISVAWDNPKQNIIPNLKNMLKIIKGYKILCYVLIGYNSTPEEDLYRVETLRALKVDPFVMPYKDYGNPIVDKDKKAYMQKFARWVNMKAVFKTCTFDEYCRGEYKMIKEWLE